MGPATVDAGEARADSVTWALPINQSIAGAVDGDTWANVTLRASVPASVSVSWALQAGNQTVAAGTPQDGTVTGSATFTWTIPTTAVWTDVTWWNITATGAFVGLLLDTTGATNLTIPAVPPPPPAPELRHLNITGNPVQLQIAGDGRTSISHYTWHNTTGDVDVAISADLVGSFNVTLRDGSGALVGVADGATTFSIRNATAGDWTITVREAMDGQATITLQQWVAPQQPAPTARDSPLPLGLALLGLWLAARSPRS